MKNIINYLQLSNFDMIVVIANVILFILIQTAFFVSVGASSFVNTLVSKLEPVKDFISLNEEAQISIEEYVNSSEWQQEKSTIETQSEEQSKQANDYLKKYLTPLLLVSLGALGFFIWRFKNGSDQWTRTHTIILGGVVLAYSSEILSYLLVMSKWEHIGSLRLLRDIVA